MKIRSLILLGLLILLMIISVVFILLSATLKLEILGSGDETILLQRDGLLTELLAEMTPDQITGAIFLNSGNDAVVIEADQFHNFAIRRSSRNWYLIDLESSQRIIKTTRIYLSNTAGSLGVNHLSRTEDFACYSLYDLIKERIEFPDQGSSNYRKGKFRSRGALLTFKVSEDAVLLIYNTGEEVWQQKNESGEVNLALDEIIWQQGINGKRQILKGIWEDPPEISSRDIYAHQIASLEEQPLLTIFIDGLGYKLWLYAQERGYTKTYPELRIETMRVVYPPKTIYNYYAFGTGELFSGDRSVGNEIFPLLTEYEKRGVILEGEMQVYSSLIPQILHPRSSADENIDTKIHHTAMEILNDYDFIFIHFQDADNNGHRYGPYSSEVMEAIERTGRYVNELTRNWNGDILIFSDHGMHQYYNQETGSIEGTHYAVRAEDMIGIFSRLKLVNDQGGTDEE